MAGAGAAAAATTLPASQPVSRAPLLGLQGSLCRLERSVESIHGLPYCRPGWQPIEPASEEGVAPRGMRPRASATRRRRFRRQYHLCCRVKPPPDMDAVRPKYPD